MAYPSFLPSFIVTLPSTTRSMQFNQRFVRSSVRPSIRPSVRLFVRPSVRAPFQSTVFSFVRPSFRINADVDQLVGDHFCARCDRTQVQRLLSLITTAFSVARLRRTVMDAVLVRRFIFSIKLSSQLRQILLR